MKKCPICKSLKSKRRCLIQKDFICSICCGVIKNEIGCKKCSYFTSSKRQTSPKVTGVISNSSIAPGNMHIFLLMGQSNMQGIQNKYKTGRVQSPNLLVLEADDSDKNNITIKWVPAHVSKYLCSIKTLVPAFSKKITEELPNTSIGIVPLAHGGSFISDWLPAKPFYNNAVKVGNFIAGSGNIKGILWHQGETDSAHLETANNYCNNLEKFITGIRKDLNNEDLPIILGQLGKFLKNNPRYPYYKIVNNSLKEASEKIPRVGYVSALQLSDHMNDKLHFDEQSLNTLGERYALEYIKIIKGKEHKQLSKSTESILPMQQQIQKSKKKSEQNLNIFILAGQSNMQGFGNLKKRQHIHHSRIFSFTNFYPPNPYSWITAKDPLYSSDLYENPPYYAIGGAGLGISFAHTLAQRYADIKIGLVMTAQEGLSIENWLPGGIAYKYFSSVTQKASAFGEIKGILWHQGENDATEQHLAAKYFKNLSLIIQSFRKELNNESLPFISGQLGDFLNDNKKHKFHKIINDALYKASTQIPSVAYVSSNQLHDEDQNDLFHFGENSLHQFGIRYAEAFIDIKNKNKIEFI